MQCMNLNIIETADYIEVNHYSYNNCDMTKLRETPKVVRYHLIVVI